LQKSPTRRHIQPTPKDAAHSCTLPRRLPQVHRKQIDQVCFTAETAALLADDQKKLKEQQAALQELELELLARQQELDRRASDLQAVEAPRFRIGGASSRTPRMMTWIIWHACTAR
jgi:septal ring factor EnvC (AmiA/AmiB activator)